MKNILDTVFPVCPHCNRSFTLDIVPRVVTPIPIAEIELLKQLNDVEIVFDVGARFDVDYLDLWPDADHHLFEPNPVFFSRLESFVVGKPNVHANNFGLGDQEEKRGYHWAFQSFSGSGDARLDMRPDLMLDIKRLDDYVNDNGIKKIDFLKIDTEGHDFKVLIGAQRKFSIIKFIQYEHWGEENNGVIMDLLKDQFVIKSVGYRNMFCMNKELVSAGEQSRLIAYIDEHKLSELI